MDRFRRWWLAVWLALVTHPMLDLMTVYGTQVALPFTDRPFGVGSVFIIDPLYTLPLLFGVSAALVLRGRSMRWNAAGLVLSTTYLAWSFGVQQHVASIAAESLRTQTIDAQRVLVTPAPFNTLLWRVVAITPDDFHEGYYSLLDREPRIAFDRFPRGAPLYEELRGDPDVERIARFSHGFFKLSQDGTRVLIADLRMGQEPFYTFEFVVGERHSAAMPVAPPVQVGNRVPFERGLSWLWHRMRGEPLAPPR
jgi:inner membrane protein